MTIYQFKYELKNYFKKYILNKRYQLKNTIFKISKTNHIENK
jgi:hypothetical protein